MLTGSKSSAYTRLTKRYKRLDDEMKLLTKKRNQLNDVLRRKSIDLFNAEDEVLTRIVESVSLVVTISAKKKEEKVSFDAEGYIQKLEQLTGLLEDNLKVIREEYTTREDRTKEVGVRVKYKEEKLKESESEDNTEKALNYIHKSLEVFDRYAEQMKNELE